MPTPHISAPDGAFAPTVLLPGDPLRAKWIADTFLDAAELVTEVRNVFGYTGTWNGNRVSVMGTGMGVPSISIYASELIDHYGCERLIRVGSCGALVESVSLRDIVIGAGASTDSGVNRTRFGGYDFAAIADWPLLHSTVAAAERGTAPVHVGNLLTADLFYSANGAEMAKMAAGMGVLAVEMEAAGLYGLAAERGAAALAICTVSDHLVHEEVLSVEDRQQSFSDMVEIALGGAFS